jgi:LmbE family N-acetylglucosaminyl deacetylase
VFAHPDDETLAAAREIHDHQASGQRNVIVLLTDGAMSGVRTVLWPELENDDLVRQEKCRQARLLESAAALGAQGIGPNDVVRYGYNEGGFTVADVKSKLVALTNNSPYQVRLKGHSPCDSYGAGLGGNSDHRKIAKALYELYANGGYQDVRFYRIGHFAGAFRCGHNGNGHAVRLSEHEWEIKQKARAEYSYPVDLDVWNWGHGTRWNYEHTQESVVEAVWLETGRYGIAALSVPDMWALTETQPECKDFPSEVGACYQRLAQLYPSD